jgi:HK97 gp10 family phage protein
MKVEFENANELIVKLDNVANIDLRKPLLKVGNDIEVAAKQNCAGKFNEPTGTLKRSIRAELVSPTSVEVGTNLEYAIYVEHGTGLWAFDGVGRAATAEHPIPWRYRGSDGMWYTTYGMQPKPFLIPAFNSKKHNIKKYIMEEYDDRF